MSGGSCKERPARNHDDPLMPKRELDLELLDISIVGPLARLCKFSRVEVGSKSLDFESELACHFLLRTGAIFGADTISISESSERAVNLTSSWGSFLMLACVFQVGVN